MNMQGSGFLEKNKLCGGDVTTIIHKQPDGHYTFGCGKVCRTCGKYYGGNVSPFQKCLGRKLIVLKRYKNRKMRGDAGQGYQDFTLGEIHDLLSEGFDVKIVCYVTKKDMTREILLRVLEEKESWSKIRNSELSKILRLGGFSAYINQLESER